MPEFLMGNYKIPKEKMPKAHESDEDITTSTTEFEKRALEKLGGSIAFVIKSKTLIWEENKRGPTK